MTELYDLVIRQARLRGRTSQLVDIGITGGQISVISEHIRGACNTEIGAHGCLVTESFVNPHLHLCKVYTLQRMDEAALRDYHAAGMGKAMSAIELAARVKEQYAESWIIRNARRAIAQAALYGCTQLRAFADVDTKARLEGVKALIRVRDEFKTIVDIQVVAFAQDGLVREPGAVDLLRQGMTLGADVVGGIPWIEFTDEDIREHIREIFDIADEYDRDVSMLVDDAGDAGLRSLEWVAVETIRRGRQGRVLAHHARAMALYPQPYFGKVASLLKRAHMAVVSDPHTGPLHARVRELLDEGVEVCLGQDDISDAYYPYGRNNLLEVAFLASHLLWMTSSTDIETLYDMITVRAARAMQVKNYGLREGNPANLVILNAPNVLEALREHAAPAYVISQGKLVDANKMRTIAQLAEW